VKFEVSSSSSTGRFFLTIERGGKILSMAGFLIISKVVASLFFPLLVLVTSIKASTFFLTLKSTPLGFSHGIFPFESDASFFFESGVLL